MGRIGLSAIFRTALIIFVAVSKGIACGFKKERKLSYFVYRDINRVYASASELSAPEFCTQESKGGIQ
jgi:hypothetical protein